MSQVTNLGFPRIGRKRELKTALESYWKGATGADALHATARELRQRHWQLQREAGADVVPVNDFTLYDHVLDTAWLFGAVPSGYLELAKTDPLAAYFATARGYKSSGRDLRALEMTKWFDTNYHYLVPELTRDQAFALCGDKPIAEFLEARAHGHEARPVLLGPVSFLLLSKTVDGSDRLALLDKLVPVYADLLGKLADAGAEWVQIDEPFLALDLCDAAQHAYRYAYAALAETRTPKLLLATYFSGLDENLPLATSLPAHGLHVDLVRAPHLLDAVLDHLPDDRVLSLGLVDGRNIWRADLHAASSLIKRARAAVSSYRLQLAPSCSLLHVPIDAGMESALEIHPWLAFACEKIAELRTLADAAEGDTAALAAVAASRELQKARRTSKLVVNPGVRERLKLTSTQLQRRGSDYAARKLRQAQTLALPVYPTTTIGSFPQTAEVRHARAAYRAGKLSESEYQTFLQNETAQAVRIQEGLDIDVLVHGEFERNDMVEYFGEQLDGFVFTKQGWVQSYGSRCVKPPIIYGDVSRPRPMTVAWSRYAQSLTKRPMKGMLTGPVTMLQWSFVRDDQSRAETCKQIALALRDEVVDLEAAGIRVIQIDEPALREGLPLRHKDRDAYLAWAVACFRIAAAGARDETQIHSHMCYAEFNDIIDAVAAMDADVISIETSRSRMELLEAFTKFQYPSGIGPGVYDIHSPHVPEQTAMLELLYKARTRLKPDQLWINPDCGLKTRDWPEVKAALSAMVGAAKALRQEA